ncbi:hypothetical protein [Arthrobacter sp.]|uniref:hypothetical protein n=1 Tax=Arthrobacter sp. TaxID=1667 RepID=UPI00258821B5|nr:hypothetical protein [Arthrobacter sp.]
MFDAYLRKSAMRTGTPFVAFDADTHHDRYVDGKSRAGTRSFLSSRGVTLPEGSPQDRAGIGTVQGLGNAKNEMVLQRMREDGVEVIGVDRVGQAHALVAHGADIVVTDLAELLAHP